MTADITQIITGFIHHITRVYAVADAIGIAVTTTADIELVITLKVAV